MDLRESNATLTFHTTPCAGLHVLRVRSDAGPLHFVPGQFVNMGVLVAGKQQLRAYSVASAPGEPEAEFVLAEVENGDVSRPLAALREGDRVYMDPHALGSFTLRDVPAGAPLLLVASGTGIAPFASMARAGLLDGRPVTVVHGARTGAALSLREVFERLPNVRYLPTVTRDPEWRGHVGRVQAVLADLRPDPATTHAMLCGNPHMIHEVRALLEAAGFKKHRKREPGNLHYEAYWSAPTSSS